MTLVDTTNREQAKFKADVGSKRVTKPFAILGDIPQLEQVHQSKSI